MTSEPAFQPSFRWPDGRRAAISITFDDARSSQVERGLPILDAHGVKGTFYVSFGRLEQHLDAWRAALARGHEIGNHTASHPCSGNFGFSRRNALEDYSLERMEEELTRADREIERLLDVVPTTFAYPCGQTFVGRGASLQSYIPLVARRFVVGRAAYNEIHNAPAFCDLAHAMGRDADDAPFEHLKAMMDAAVRAGGWLILYGHEVGGHRHQTVRAEALDALCRHIQNPANQLWVDTVAAVGSYVELTRAALS